MVLNGLKTSRNSWDLGKKQQGRLASRFNPGGGS